MCENDNIEKPLVSIITPCYNAEMYIEETIQSVLVQIYKNWEMIIVDDISTDRTFDIIKNYMKVDNRIRCFQLKQKGGASIARNKGIKESKGKYVAFLDADDLWKS